MNCLSCEKKIEEADKFYHPLCLRKLFDSAVVPKINFAYSDIPAEAQKLIGKMSISGVQPKLSVAIKKRVLEVAAAGGTHILKPTPEAFPFLSENENLCMNMAQDMGHEIPPHGLLKMKGGRLAYIVRRFDRSRESEKIHVEDFAQLLEKTDKYDGSVEQIGKFLKWNSSVPFVDTQKLFARVLFCFLIGNGDAHLKNFAMIQTTSGYRLSPAYDMVSSRLVMPSETHEMAIAINGRKNRIDKRDFESLADYLEINDKQRHRIFESIRAMETRIGALIGSSFLSQTMQKTLASLFKERFHRLFGEKI